MGEDGNVKSEITDLASQHLSSPYPLLISFARIAQLVVHLPCKQGVCGSSPYAGTILIASWRSGSAGDC